MKHEQANVIDQDQRPVGMRAIRVAFVDGVPSVVEHAGRTYRATGKQGTNMKTGRDVVELATDRDARIWVTLDAKHVFED